MRKKQKWKRITEHQNPSQRPSEHSIGWSLRLFWSSNLKSNIISIMRSRDVKWFECPSLLIHLPRDLLFWIPVTDALAFDDYTILHLTDHLDCAVDLFSLQHLATSWLSEFLTELRNDRCIFILHSDYTVCLMVACGDIPAQDFHQRFCSRISFRILTLDSGSLRCA